MAKPAKLPVWATDAAADVEEPPAAKKLVGWLKEKPPHQWFNWWQELVHDWCAFVDDYSENHVHDGGATDNSAPKVDLADHIGYGANGKLEVTVDTLGNHEITHTHNEGGGLSQFVADYVKAEFDVLTSKIRPRTSDTVLVRNAADDDDGYIRGKGLKGGASDIEMLTANGDAGVLTEARNVAGHWTGHFKVIWDAGASEYAIEAQAMNWVTAVTVSDNIASVPSGDPGERWVDLSFDQDAPSGADGIIIQTTRGLSPWTGGLNIDAVATGAGAIQVTMRDPNFNARESNLFITVIYT